MVNIDDFIKRLEHLMDYYTLNASAFADKIGVQRSSISHLLSGRNKPSLDFVMKIMDVFPNVNLYWMLDGKQSFLKSDLVAAQLTAEKTVNHSPTTTSKIEEIESTLFDHPKVTNLEPVLNIANETTSPKKTIPGSAIFKIVVFYADGTFKSFDELL